MKTYYTLLILLVASFFCSYNQASAQQSPPQDPKFKDAWVTLQSQKTAQIPTARAGELKVEFFSPGVSQDTMNAWFSSVPNRIIFGTPQQLQDGRVACYYINPVGYGENHTSDISKFFIQPSVPVGLNLDPNNEAARKAILGEHPDKKLPKPKN